MSRIVGQSLRICRTAAAGIGRMKNRGPRHSVSAPACTSSATFSVPTPPIHLDAVARHCNADAAVLTREFLLSAPGMKDCPPNPGFTDITRTVSTRSSTSTSVATGVAD